MRCHLLCLKDFVTFVVDKANGGYALQSVNAFTAEAIVRYAQFSGTTVSSQTYRNKLKKLDLLYGKRKVYPINSERTYNN
jgi:hypothetical protein